MPAAASVYSMIDCITAFSKSRISSWFEVCTMRMATIFSFGSTQKCVPKAPLQPKQPLERAVPSRDCAADPAHTEPETLAAVPSGREIAVDFETAVMQAIVE